MSKNYDAGTILFFLEMECEITYIKLFFFFIKDDIYCPCYGFN